MPRFALVRSSEMRRARLAVTVLVAIIALLHVGCEGEGMASSSASSAQPGSPSSSATAGAAHSDPKGGVRNVVVVSIDTLRADHLGAYGYPLPTSPRFDRFAAGAVRFGNCHSASGHTLSSHKAMLSGKHVTAFLAAYSKAGGPPGVLGSASDYYRLAFRGWPFPSLARRLKQLGLATAGFADGVYLDIQYGFSDGFDVYRSERLGFARQRQRAADWLANHSDKPFFLFIHCYDVHCPYDPPAEYLKRFESACTGRLRFQGNCGKSYFDELDLTAEEKAHITRHYDAGILHADDELGKFLDDLERAGRFRDTLIIVTSDHGESLGERDFVGHGQLYDNQLGVPLVIYAPGVKPGVVRVPVAGVDILPTILDLLTGRAPQDVDGWSLTGLLNGAPSSGTSTIAGTDSARAYSGRTPGEFEKRPRVAAITVNEPRHGTRLRKVAVEGADHLKLILDLESGTGELFDLARDSRESRNLAGPGAQGHEHLRELARGADPGALKGFDPHAQPGKEGEGLSPEMLEQLRALGYAK